MGIRAIFGRKLHRPMVLGFDTTGVLKIIANVWDLLVKQIPSEVVGHGGWTAFGRKLDRPWLLGPKLPKVSEICNSKKIWWRLKCTCVPPSARDGAGFGLFNPIEERYRYANSLRVSEWGALVNEALLSCSCISMSLSSRDVVARAETLKLTVAAANTWGIDKGRSMSLQIYVYVCRLWILNSL